VQRQTGPEEKKEEELTQAKQASGQASHAGPNLEAQVRSLKGDGKPLPKSTRDFFEPRFGYDFSQVQVHTGDQAAKTARKLNARAFTVGRDVILGTRQYTLATDSGKRLMAHELTHVIQQTGGLRTKTMAGQPDNQRNQITDWPVRDVTWQEQRAETNKATNRHMHRQTEEERKQSRASVWWNTDQLCRTNVNELTAAPISVMRGKGKMARKVVGWIVKVGERKLIKKTPIYTEKQMAKLLGKGYNVLVKRGKSVAKRVAKKVWEKDVIHHTGHIIKKTGKLGKSHFQPLKRLLGKPGEKGWHIFYSAAPIIFFADSTEAMAIYEDKYPGKSVANYLTVTHYVGEESWLSYLDWVNPLELIAIGGDIGRAIDRELSKELKAIVFTRVTPNGTKQSYELDPGGNLVRVIAVSKEGKEKRLSADEFYSLLAAQSETKPKVSKEEGTGHPNYASTFDAGYRIYISKRGWSWDPKTLSFFLPESYAKKLKKIGKFYVNENFSIVYVYAFVEPKLRSVLKQPGFLIPEENVWDYARSSNKEMYLNNMLESAITISTLKHVELWK
jgi:hypothetical protein